MMSVFNSIIFLLLHENTLEKIINFKEWKDVNFVCIAFNFEIIYYSRFHVLFCSWKRVYLLLLFFKERVYLTKLNVVVHLYIWFVLCMIKWLSLTNIPTESIMSWSYKNISSFPLSPIAWSQQLQLSSFTIFYLMQCPLVNVVF